MKVQSNPKVARRYHALWADVMRSAGFITFVLGVITGALGADIGGFTSIHWFLMAIFSFSVVIAAELFQLRMSLDLLKGK